MKVIYNRISETRHTEKEAFEYYKETLIDCGVSESEIFTMGGIDDLCDKLNELDIYGCGTCFSIEYH